MTDYCNKCERPVGWKPIEQCSARLLTGHPATHDQWASAELSCVYQRHALVDARLGGLLAVVHRDGGHHQQKHGQLKAIENAVALIYKERERLAELERFVEELRALDDRHEYDELRWEATSDLLEGLSR